MSRDAVLKALSPRWQTKKQIADAAGLSGYGVKKYLGKLIEQGRVEKTIYDGTPMFRMKR